jgi:hypothetical protein
MLKPGEQRIHRKKKVKAKKAPAKEIEKEFKSDTQADIPVVIKVREDTQSPTTELPKYDDTTETPATE